MGNNKINQLIRLTKTGSSIRTTALTLKQNTMKTKHTTAALNENQHLIKVAHPNLVETFCIGYTNGKRDRKLDGYYYNSEIKQIKKATL